MNEIAGRIHSAIERIRLPIARHALALLNKLRDQIFDIFRIDPKVALETVCRT
jgi:hypothetical protein